MLASLIGNRNREHPVEPLEYACIVLLVSMDHHRVCRRRESVSHRLRQVTQLAGVVDLSVEHHDDVILLVRDRLITAIDIEGLLSLT